MEQVWENLKNDSDKVDGDLGDIAVMDANNETNKEEMNEVTAEEKGNASIHILSVSTCYFFVGVSK